MSSLPYPQVTCLCVPASQFPVCSSSRVTEKDLKRTKIYSHCLTHRVPFSHCWGPGAGVGGRQNFTQRVCSLCLVHSFALGSSVGQSWEIKEKKQNRDSYSVEFCILASVSNLPVFINLSGSNQIQVLEIRLR